LRNIVVRKVKFGDNIEKGENMNNEFITFTIRKQKTIALIAHDGKKQELINWCEENQDILKNHFLCGTGTTARLVAEKTGLPVKGYNSGPLGGDQQIGAKIVEGVVDFVIFFSDPLEAQPHDPDVKALLRIAQVYDIPIANNKATADFMIHSTLMNQEYEHKVINFKQNIINRVNDKKLIK
jgi:methylglyoxal synthase